MNFVRNSYETTRRIREGVTRQGKARESFGSQLKASSNLFSMGAASAASKIPKSDPDVTLNNLSSTGIYVPEDFNRATLGAFVTKGRFSSIGAPAVPFLMSSGLSRTKDISKKQPELLQYYPNLSGTQSASSIGNRIQAQTSIPVTNSQTEPPEAGGTSHEEQRALRMPSFEAFGAGDPTSRPGRLGSTGVRGADLHYFQSQRIADSRRDRFTDQSDSTQANPRQTSGPATNPPDFRPQGVEIVHIARLKDSSGGTWSKPRVSAELEAADVGGLSSGVGSSRTHLVAAAEEGSQQARPHPPGVLKHSSSSSTNLHAHLETVPKSVRFLEPPISPETWANTADRLPLLLEQAELDAEIHRRQLRLADSKHWSETWRISSQQMIVARGREIEITKQRIQREKENLLTLIEQEDKIYQEAYKLLGGKEEK